MTEEMGLVGKVDDARKNLEVIFNMKLPPPDPKESK